ncbi:hypothetical protein OROGR_004975 [Orobanche gracilis]
MASEGTVSDVRDPLSGLFGPLLFPRTIKTSADVPLPSDPKDRDSIHNFMKSLDLGSPERLMNEAKRTVDGGAELLKSSLASFAEIVGIPDAIPAENMYNARQRRPCIGRARKRAPFSLKTNISQPPVLLEPTMDMDDLEDPYELWATYARLENAKKEIRRQQGGIVDDQSTTEPSNKPRPRRPTISTKRHHRQRYPLGTFRNNEVLQESVAEDIPSAPKDNIQGIEIVDEDIPVAPKDPNPDADLEEFKLPGTIKKAEDDDIDLFDDPLTRNVKGLKGDEAYNILQELLNIEPLDMENLGNVELLDGGKNSISTMSETISKLGSSLEIGSLFKYFNKQIERKHKTVKNPVNPASSPTPPKSPFGSLSLLRKKIMQPNPLSDPFSSVDLGLSELPSASAAQPKLFLQVNASKNLGMSSESESHADVGNTEPLVSNVDAREMIETIVYENIENASVQDDDVDSRLFEEPANDIDSTMNVNGNENASVHAAADSRPFEEPGHDIDSTMNVKGNEDASVHAAAAADSRPLEEPDNDIDRAMNVNGIADESNPCIPEEASDDTLSRQQTDPEQQPELHQAKLPRRKGVAGEKRMREAHPMRKSLADTGTSFETGVRRSKRIKMRPLEYWKGERFVYGRVDNSMKLIAVKYISPGKGKLKVKPYVMVESSKFKEELELAARH